MANSTPGAPGARRRRSLLGTSAMIGAGALVAGFAFAPTASAVEASDFADAVTVDGIMEHLEAFQAIADANGGNRAIGTEGYELSGQYVEAVLQAAGYETERQDFTTTTQTIDEFSLTTTPAVEGIPMSFTPSTPEGGVTGELIQPTDPLGCTADAWAGLDATGKVALVSRGTCSFAEKSAAAGAAGASAILIYNNAPGEALNGTLGAPDDSYIPSVGITLEEGQALIAALPTTATLVLEQTTTDTDTFNIITETEGGDHDNVVMLGAHLDGVPEGPGINDNGSGSATLLETAVELAEAGETTNAVRFAWWGAEEVGLVGSYEYVDSLTQEEADKIATYMNFDMVASPNYVISVYDANESTYEAPVEVPAGSIATEKAFTDYFDSIGQPWIDTAFDGRSDYDGFISVGIPSSGVFTGADDIKTEEEAALFGGTVGIPHDPNYHSEGDDLANINQEALGITSKAIAYVTASFAEDTSAIDEEKNPTPPSPTPTPITLPTRAEVLRLLTSGLSYREIAAELGVTGDNAEQYLDAVLDEVGISRATAERLVREYLDDRGLLTGAAL
ncbi:M20/M25/M40 family metallo-hydrolase [Rathayibacter sp. ZW T2_19]|uniref:M20/M25/M40 family metallo-hydrolase n=1 Tax=Rathayibacter rubneri TaxID=2950106 RepID=A0A9X2E0D9_9MICO|nr:M20/M25/M40 family metallo-hydrolase [Rathayibacter rubneri]MCM6763098.1 M20/M25/M40 family metallo-hydrolase [Rathayibacter rubneri]